MSEDTPTRILKAALVGFSERGYSGTSMRRIAAIVGVQAPSIYAHFSSKEALLKALLERQGPVSVPLCSKRRAQRPRSRRRWWVASPVA